MGPLSHLKNIAHPWLLWIAIVLVGNAVLAYSKIDTEFLYASGLITIAIAYPVFLAAIKRTWPRRKLLAIAAMALHSWLLVVVLAVVEAAVAGLTEANLLLFFIITVSFGIPIYLARGQKPSETHKRSLGTIVVTVVLSILVVFGALVFFYGAVISGVEFAQANAFRAFCEHKVQGSSIEEIRRLVPARFIRPRQKKEEFQISSHGRGCVVLNRDGKLIVLQLLPERGFPWMLAAPPGAGLQGTFEKGGVGQQILFPDLL
jgi:hypothetical protein